MSTYLRESDRFESTFPSIRNRTGLLESTQRSRITTLDDELLDRDVRGSRTTYTTTVQRSAPPGGRDSPIFYPRPPSPSRENRKVMMEVCIIAYLHQAKVKSLLLMFMIFTPTDGKHQRKNSNSLLLGVNRPSDLR